MARLAAAEDARIGLAACAGGGARLPLLSSDWTEPNELTPRLTPFRRSATNSSVAPRPSKRAKSGRPALVTLEGALSEEILLLCLSFLEVDDLLALALVSSSWNRLSQDPDVRPRSSPRAIHTLST